MRFVALAAVVAVVGVGCDVIFEVEKQVTNGTSNGPFEVAFSCVNDAGTQNGSLTYNGPGTQTTEFGTSPIASTTCTVTEPESASAATVTLECVSPPVGVTCTPGSGTLEVVIPSTSSDTFVDLRVTNDFTGVQTTPDPPIDVTATLGSIIVSWTAPSNTGTSPLIGYVVTQSPGGAAFNVVAPLTTLTLPCPNPGTYSYTVTAVNGNGSSAPSAPSNEVTVASLDAECIGVQVQPQAILAAPTSTG